MARTAYAARHTRTGVVSGGPLGPGQPKKSSWADLFWYWDLKNSLCQSASKNRPKRRSGEKLHASVPPGPASGSHVTDALHGASQHHVQLRFGRFGHFLQTWHAKMRRAHVHFALRSLFCDLSGFSQGLQVAHATSASSTKSVELTEVAWASSMQVFGDRRARMPVDCRSSIFFGARTAAGMHAHVREYWRYRASVCAGLPCRWHVCHS